MARIREEGDTFRVHLSWLEKLGAFHGDIRVPRSSVVAVRRTDDPWGELRGMRAPGTGIPGVIALGTRRGVGVKDFAAVYRNQPAVVVELDQAPFNRLVISIKDPAELGSLVHEGAPRAS